MISVQEVERILKSLTVDIGIRLAGSPGDKQAAAFVQNELERSGAEVSVEEFPVLARRVTEEKLELRIRDSWQSFGCSLFSSTPGTAGKTLEAPLIFFTSPTDYRRRDLSFLGGKAVVHLGCHIESREHYRRLIDARPAFLLMADSRYPGSIPLADGMFPAYTRALGAVPTVNVAYQDAWRWKLDGAVGARLLVRGGMEDSVSQNVIAEFAGSDDQAEILFVGGHHDTQAGSPGADDNGTGTAAVIELTRLLADKAPFRRTIRLISFGAEEQLSVGSAEYVRRHRSELARRSGFMLNFDSFGSHLGWFVLTANGSIDMGEYLRRYYENSDLWMDLVSTVVPYADHFPFAAAGIPGVYLGRNNCTAGRFFHHRPDDDIHQVSMDLVADVIRVSADLLTELAEMDSLPFPPSIPSQQAEQIAVYWEDLFGGWAPEHRAR